MGRGAVAKQRCRRVVPAWVDARESKGCTTVALRCLIAATIFQLLVCFYKPTSFVSCKSLYFQLDRKNHRRYGLREGSI